MSRPPAPPSEFDAPEFLDALRAGENRAYRALIRRFHGSLVGVASGIIGSRAQAEEVVQDAWLAVFNNINRFEGRSSLASWLFTIVLNRARTRITREARMVALPPVLDGIQGDEPGVPRSQFSADGHWVDPPKLWDELDPEREIGGRQLWAHVQEVIQTLPAGQKAVIILRDIEDRTAEEACALLEISPENQRVLLHRARHRIRRAIDDLTGAPATQRRPAAPKRLADRNFCFFFQNEALSFLKKRSKKLLFVKALAPQVGLHRGVVGGLAGDLFHQSRRGLAGKGFRAGAVA